jgi:hypothetical protein
MYHKIANIILVEKKKTMGITNATNCLNLIKYGEKR